MEFSQSGIKIANIQAIFRTILRRDSISRAEISERTGISLMTVGKIADDMLDAGILVQRKPATGASGRRAGYLSLAQDKIFLVADVSAQTFRASVVDTNLQALQFFNYPCNYDFSPKENLMGFFGEMNKLLFECLPGKKLAGTGLVLPTNYDCATDTVVFPRYFEEKISVNQLMRQSLGFSADISDNRLCLSARAESREPYFSKGCTLTLLIDDSLFGCIAVNGRVLVGEDGSCQSDFSHLVAERDGFSMPINKFVAESKSESELAYGLGNALRSLAFVLCPAAIFVESGSRRFTTLFADELTKNLSTDRYSPKVIIESDIGKHCEEGIASALRERWVNNALGF